ncbi:La-related protein 6A, partial [Zea mays]
MKKLVQDLSVIEAALRTSSKLVVSSNGKRVRRLHPLPHKELKDSKKSTVLVENLPPDFSMESIQEKIATVGKFSQAHVLIEYEVVEAAEK